MTLIVVFPYECSPDLVLPLLHTNWIRNMDMKYVAKISNTLFMSVSLPQKKDTASSKKLNFSNFSISPFVVICILHLKGGLGKL